MDCQDCIRRLAEFLEADFDAAAAAVLSEHLAECDGCGKTRVEDAFVRKVRDCCSGDTAPPALRDRIVERIHPVS
ncbi:hypothetical protein BH18CHL2_BH18CHL2_00210 [soil metagenome]